jgi:hypothetical protein
MISNEHKRAGLFTHGEVLDLNMPDGYKRSIVTWFAHLTADRGQTRPQPPRWPRQEPAMPQNRAAHWGRLWTITTRW